MLFDEIHIDASSNSSLIEPNCFSNSVYSLKVVKLNNLLREPIEIEPSSMDKYAFDFLHRFRPGGHFTMVQGYH